LIAIMFVTLGSCLISIVIVFSTLSTKANPSPCAEWSPVFPGRIKGANTTARCRAEVQLFLEIVENGHWCTAQKRSVVSPNCEFDINAACARSTENAALAQIPVLLSSGKTGHSCALQREQNTEGSNRGDCVEKLHFWDKSGTFFATQAE
jgi:hypothetical protein